MTCFSKTRFIEQQRVTWFILYPTISGHFEGGNLITLWSCDAFYQDIFDRQLIASIEAWFFPKPDFGFNLLIFKA